MAGGRGASGRLAAKLLGHPGGVVRRAAPPAFGHDRPGWPSASSRNSIELFPDIGYESIRSIWALVARCGDGVTGSGQQVADDV